MNARPSVVFESKHDLCFNEIKLNQEMEAAESCRALNKDTGDIIFGKPQLGFVIIDSRDFSLLMMLLVCSPSS